MSTDSYPASCTLPERPDLRHLKGQAKDLLRAGSAASLSDAQFKVARQYGFASWPKLKGHVESLQEIGQLKSAIDANDLAHVKELMTRNPGLHNAPLGYHKNGPLTWTAECRGAPPTAERLAIARWMLEHGSDVHQGGDGPLMRAALSDARIPMMELLVEYGADVNALWDGRYPIIFAACETLQPGSLEWLIAHGADIWTVSKEFGNCAEMLLGTAVPYDGDALDQRQRCAGQAPFAQRRRPEPASDLPQTAHRHGRRRTRANARVPRGDCDRLRSPVSSARMG